MGRRKKQKQYSLQLPLSFKRRLEPLKEKYSNYRIMFETAIRNYITKHKKEEPNSFVWSYNFTPMPDLIDEVNKRIPYDFISNNQAVVIAMTEFLIEEEKNAETNEE